MLDTIAMEDLHIAFLSAICSKVGIRFDKITHDETSVDGHLRKKYTYNNGQQVDVSIEVQLKSTFSQNQYNENEDSITYRLKAKNYNDMCTKRNTPIFLGLLILPEDKDEWINCGNEELLLKGRMYLKSFADCEKTHNSSSVSVQISKRNLLTPHYLNSVMKSIGREWIDND